MLTARDCLTLARPLLRGELSILAGRLAMVLLMHSGSPEDIDGTPSATRVHSEHHRETTGKNAEFPPQQGPGKR